MPSRFDHSTRRISQQEGYPLFLLHQVNSMRGTGSGQPSRSKGMLRGPGSSPLRTFLSSQVPGATQDDRKAACISRGSPGGKVTTEYKLNCYRGTYIGRNIILLELVLIKSHLEDEYLMCPLSHSQC